MVVSDIKFMYERNICKYNFVIFKQIITKEWVNGNAWCMMTHKSLTQENTI